MEARQFFRGVRGGLGFLTSLPLGFDEADFDAFMSHAYLFIVVGAIIGAIIGIAGFILRWLVPETLVPVLVIAFTFLLTGINHLDGLSDFGDGVIAHGSREKKVAAMKDVHAGAGGILFIAMDLLFLYSALSLFSGFGSFYLMIGLFIAEVCAKVSMITVAAFGKSLGPGMGSALIEKTKKEHYMIGLAIALVACMAAAGALAPLPLFWHAVLLHMLAGLLAVSASVALGLFIIDVAGRNFGGVNGDVMGAANEMGRAAALVILGILIWKPW